VFRDKNTRVGKQEKAVVDKFQIFLGPKKWLPLSQLKEFQGVSVFH
jgi:hypothetical protein